ncbi:MAG TPA: hypothetical protein VJ816_08830, partial [Gemmatimonadales bacterium]|nr:hypothetical protein [Gemmatimonadales bacterium]
MTATPTWIDRLRSRPRTRTALAAILPVGWVTVFLFLPYLLLLLHSLWRLDENQMIVHQWTLASYRRLFTTSVYPATILFSAQIAFVVTVCSLLLAFPLAYL